MRLRFCSGDGDEESIVHALKIKKLTTHIIIIYCFRMGEGEEW